jgi:predicted alpha/beta-fold hydrolase
VRPYLPGIQVPTLLINALNDPFLTPECFPVPEAEVNQYLFLEMPRHGGHVGFSSSNSEECWSEKRAVEFVLSDQGVIA